MVAPSSGEGEQEMKLLLLLRLWPHFGPHRLPYFLGREAFEGVVAVEMEKGTGEVLP